LHLGSCNNFKTNLTIKYLKSLHIFHLADFLKKDWGQKRLGSQKRLGASLVFCNQNWSQVEPMKDWGHMKDWGQVLYFATTKRLGSSLVFCNQNWGQVEPATV
jgi:hypothetical protein